MNITEKYEACLHEMANNSSIEIIDYQTKKYEPVPDFVIDFMIEGMEEDGYIVGEEAKSVMRLCGAMFGWSSALDNVDYVLTGGTLINGFSDALGFYSSFWKGAFSLAHGVEVPEELKHFEQLGWFERRPDGNGDHNRGCFIKQAGNFPPPIVFYSSSWYTKLNMNLEEYLSTMFDNYAVSGWQFFYIDITEDIPELEIVLREMRIVVEQMPLLFPDKDWSYHKQRYEETLKRLQK